MCLASTLCKYDLRMGDLFVLSWARVRLMRRGSLPSELLMCGGGVRSILYIYLYKLNWGNYLNNVGNKDMGKSSWEIKLRGMGKFHQTLEERKQKPACGRM